MVDGWGTLSTILRVALITLVIYAYLVVLLRLTGNRTLAKLRAFDFIVTIAIGSVVASTTVTGNNASLLNGIVAVTMLVGLQWVVAYVAARSDFVNRLVTSPPTLLLYDGKYLDKNLKQARITKHQLQLWMRRQNFQDEREVLLAILEPNGEITLLGKKHQKIPLEADRSTVHTVPGIEKRSRDREPEPGTES